MVGRWHARSDLPEAQSWDHGSGAGNPLPDLKGYGLLVARGFTLVGLTATNVGQVAGQHWWGALGVGFLISFIWFGNARSAAHTSLKFAREAYSLGAALGTIFGMFIVKVIYG